MERTNIVVRRATNLRRMKKNMSWVQTRNLFRIGTIRGFTGRIQFVNVDKTIRQGVL
jgi:hypothetical protein